MKIYCTKHSIERVIERRDGIENKKDAEVFLRKKFSNILKWYNEWKIWFHKFNKDWKIKLISFWVMFVYKKIKGVITIITFYDYHIWWLKEYINRFKKFSYAKTSLEIKKLHVIVENHVYL
jgi:hypothetical protein